MLSPTPWCRRETNYVRFGGALIVDQATRETLKSPAIILGVAGRAARWLGASSRRGSPISLCARGRQIKAVWKTQNDCFIVRHTGSWIGLIVGCVRTENNMPRLTQTKQPPQRQSFLVPLNHWYPEGEIKLLGVSSLN